MPDEQITAAEAGARVEVAAESYSEWTTEDLWSEFGLCTDEAWQHATGDEPEPLEWAKREAIGLALVDRGFTAADLQRGYPLKGQDG